MAKLNVQGLARRDPGLMRCIEPDAGNVLVSVDLSAGEPTCTTHYSGDKNYYDATFGMVGKAPYYHGDVLKIDDIYLTGMSVSPIGRKEMFEAFHSRYGTASFAEKWLEDKDFFTKGALGKSRSLHKTLILGLGYSMGPRKLVKSAYEKGHVISYPTAKEFFNAYWTLFSGVKALGNRLEKVFAAKGFLVNDFGYRLIPDAGYKCLNYFIQSSVSGVMHVLSEKFFGLCDFAQFVTVIHDELLFEVPAARLNEAKVLMERAEDSLNADLGWSVRIRTGWAPGRDWYEAK